MLNAVELATIATSVTVAIAMIFENRLRRQGHRLAVTCIYIAGFFWWCLLIFGQPYVRPAIRVAVGTIAILVLARIIWIAFSRNQPRQG